MTLPGAFRCFLFRQHSMEGMMARNQDQAVAHFKALIGDLEEMLKPFEKGEAWIGGRNFDEKATQEHMDELRSLIELYEQQIKILT